MLVIRSLRLMCLMACLMSAFLISGAQAMQHERSFPEGVKRGKLSTTELADLVIDGKVRYSSVALRIYDEENRIVLPASLYVKNVLVYYLINEMGEVHRVWILTEEEARRPVPKS